MTLTAEEAENALALKAKFLAAADIEDLTDFEIAQFAIVSKTDHDKAMQRVRQLQTLRRRYNVGSTTEDVQASLDFIEQNSPGLFLGLSTAKEGCTVLFNNAKRFQSNRKIRGEEGMARMISFMVHILEAASPDIEAVRNGLVSVSLCDGIGWGNFNPELERRGAEVYQDSFPIRMKGIYMLDPPFILNAMMEIVKIFMSKKTRALINNEKTTEFLEADLVEKAALPEKLGGTLAQSAFAGKITKSYQKYLLSKETFRL